jgi:hypothetical protein
MKAQLIKVLWALDFGRKRVGLNFAGPTTYAITCGEPMGYPGGTNMLKVCEVR